MAASRSPKHTKIDNSLGIVVIHDTSSIGKKLAVKNLEDAGAAKVFVIDTSVEQRTAGLPGLKKIKSQIKEILKKNTQVSTVLLQAEFNICRSGEDVLTVAYLLKVLDKAGIREYDLHGLPGSGGNSSTLSHEEKTKYKFRSMTGDEARQKLKTPEYFTHLIQENQLASSPEQKDNLTIDHLSLQLTHSLTFPMKPLSPKPVIPEPTIKEDCRSSILSSKGI